MRFEYYEPTSITQAISFADHIPEETKWLAGGTELLPKVKQRAVKADHIINLKNDPETGDVKILNVVAKNDCGRVQNLLFLNGQSEGSVHMGISHALYGQMQFEKEGKTPNPCFLNYGS